MYFVEELHQCEITTLCAKLNTPHHVSHGPSLAFTQGSKRPEIESPSGRNSGRPGEGAWDLAGISAFCPFYLLMGQHVSTNPPSISLPTPLPALGKNNKYRYRLKGNTKLIMGYLFRQRLCHCKIQSLPRGPTSWHHRSYSRSFPKGFNGAARRC